MAHRIVNHVKSRSVKDRRTAAHAPAENLVPIITPEGAFRGIAEARDFYVQNKPMFWIHLIKKYDNLEDIAHSVYNMIRYNVRTGMPGWEFQ